MADASDLGSGSERIGGSSPLARTTVRMAQVQDVAKVSLEAGNSPRMVFSNYRELVRTADAEKWFGITPEAIGAAKSLRTATGQNGAAAKIVPLPAAA